MNPIEEIIKLGPNENVEFLTEIDELIDFAKICVSFANKFGGSIFIGVNKKGKMIGVNPAPELILVNQVNDFIDGNLKIETIPHIVKHYYIIEVKISKSEIPILVKLNDGTKAFYYRVESNTIEANKIIERYLNLRRFSKTVEQSKLHANLLDRIGDDEFNLSMLYKLMDIKPNEVDKLIAELIFIQRIDVRIIDKKLYYSRLKL